jgi:NADH-quinone oxidoreductase subunit E
MLTDQETREIEEEIKKYPEKQGAAVEALMVVQKHRGWVTAEALRDLARMLDISDDHLDSIATSYNLIFRRPVGRHVILLCDGVACWILRGESFRDALMQRLGIGFGQTTADGRFTLLPSACLGACDRAPAMMIDNDLHVNLDQRHLDYILEEYD